MFSRDLGGDDNPPLIILHGLLGSSKNWMTVGKLLTDKYHVIALDLRNHGDSDHFTVHDYPSMVLDMKCWLDHAGMDKVTIIGHSMGGKVAMKFACDYPSKVERLIVVDIAPKDYDDHSLEIEALGKIDLSKIESKIQAEELLIPSISDLGMRKFLLTNLVRNKNKTFSWRINLKVLLASLPEIRSSSLLVGDYYDGSVVFIKGGESDFILSEDHPLIYNFFKNVNILEIDGADHNPHFSKREDFIKIINKSL